MIITEKFALLNILKALEGLSGNQAASDTVNKTSASAENAAVGTATDVAEVKADLVPNVMAGVIERHERISNRVRSSLNRNT